MTLRFACPHCRKRLKAAGADRGRSARCGGCGKTFEVPRTETGSEPPRDLPTPSSLRTEPPQDDEIDMTPMIDVVFQLLIFFMVTATYALQQALPLPTPESSDAVSQQASLDEPRDDDDVLRVRVDADDTIWVDDELTVSRFDLIDKLRRAGGSSGSGGERAPRRMLVSADPDAHHEAVVLALDAGSAAGMDEVRLTTVDDAE